MLPDKNSLEKKHAEGTLKKLLDVRRENWRLRRRYASVPNELSSQKRHVESVFEDAWKVITDGDDVVALHKLLEENGPRVIKMTNEKGSNLIHQAVLHGRAQCLHLLISSGCNMNATDVYQETPLIWAIRYSPLQSRMECVAILVKRQALLDEGTPTPLWIAVSMNDFPMVQFLVGSGSDTDVRFHFGESRVTPKFLAKQKGYANMESFLEFTECARGIEKASEEVVKSLVAKKPHLLKEKDQNGNTLLHLAASLGKASLVDLLIPGSEINAVNNMERTPFFLSAAFGHLSCVRRLKECKDLDDERKDKDGFTPLRKAASKNQIAMVLLLVSYGKCLEGSAPSSPAHWCRHHKLPLDLVEK